MTASAACWACAWSGHATIAPPSPAMNWRRRILFDHLRERAPCRLDRESGAVNPVIVRKGRLRAAWGENRVVSEVDTRLVQRKSKECNRLRDAAEMCPRRRESSHAPRRLAFDALSYLATKLPQHFVAIGLLNNALDAAIEAG